MMASPTARERKEEAEPTARRWRSLVHQPAQMVVGEQHLIAEILDMGEDGLRLRSSRPLEVDGHDVQLHIALPARGQRKPRRYTLQMRVIWRAGLLAGLRFCDPAAARPQVAELLRQDATVRT